MLPSLGIRNYRNLKSLDIERLARVNLIAGKNNTGKTSLLEAVSLYAAGGDLGWINQILFDREEIIIRRKGEETASFSSINPDSYLSLFYNRQADFVSSKEKIVVGEVGAKISGPGLVNTNLVSIRAVCFIKQNTDSKNGKTIRTIVLETEDDLSYPGDIYQGIEVVTERKTKLHNLETGIVQSTFHGPKDTTSYRFQFVKTKSTESNYNSILWDKIVLTECEDFVVEALKIIDPSVDRITFIDKATRNRKPVVKLKNQKTVLPLQSMGDGMNRILSIILALVNAEDGYLLIDEFENGLHHKVQEDLWKMIFKLAKELNVQVFATTHSDDCIAAFEEVLSDSNQNKGLFIRLEKHGDTIKPVLFDAKELQVATDHEIEIR